MFRVQTASSPGYLDHVETAALPRACRQTFFITRSTRGEQKQVERKDEAKDGDYGTLSCNSRTWTCAATPVPTGRLVSPIRNMKTSP